MSIPFLRRGIVASARPQGNPKSVDFGDYAAATGIPAGFTDMWTTSNVATSIVADAAATGGKYLRRAPSAQARRSLGWSDGGSRTNAEVEVRFRIAAKPSAPTSARADFGLALRAGGAATTESAHVLSFWTLADNTQDIRIYGYSGGAGTAATTGPAVTLTLGTWYRLLFRANATAMSGYFWADGAAMPTTPTVSATQTEVTGAGLSGLFNFATAFDYQIDTLRVADVV